MPWPFPLRTSLRTCGPFPPRALPRLYGTTGHSATLSARPDPCGLPVGVCYTAVRASIDRDRWGPHGPHPPTPPCVRVRTRRFNGLEQTDLGARATRPLRAGSSDSGCAVRTSVPSPRAPPDSPGLSHAKGSVSWIFCRIARMSLPSYYPCPLFGPSSAKPTTMPSADFCVAVTCLTTRSVRLSRTQRRSPRVRPTAFPAHPPNLPPRRIDDADFAITGSLVRSGRPRIRFLFIGSQVCSTLPSDPASRRRPCASLILRRHLAG